MTRISVRELGCIALGLGVLAAPAHADDTCPAPAAAADEPRSDPAGATLAAPGGIFLELGLWQSVVEASRATATASAEARPRARIDALAARAYAELMLGRPERAQRTLERARELVEADPDDARLLAAYLDMHARHVVETRSWPDIDVWPAGRSEFEATVPGLDGIRTSAHGPWLYAAGAESAARADIEAATAVGTQLERLARRREADGRPHAARTIYVLSAELATAIARAQGQSDEARRAARQAAELERELDARAAPPLPVKPAAELHGEVLLESGCAAAAAEVFARTLERRPNRTPALLGLARAERARGDAAAAWQAYARIATMPGARREAAAVREAREFLGAD